MRKPSPELLDLFYRSNGFPIDDLDVRDFVQHTSSVMASTWFVPTHTIPAVFFIMGGGSGDLSALIYELRRLALITEATAAALPNMVAERSGSPALCYHYFVNVTHLDARVYSKSVEDWDEALTPLLHVGPLHPWFRPTDDYAEIYKNGVICSANLPAVDFDDAQAADYLGDPEHPVAKRASRASNEGSDDSVATTKVGGHAHGLRRSGLTPNDRERDRGGADAEEEAFDGLDGFDTAGLTPLSEIKLSAADLKLLKMPSPSVEDDFNDDD
jgi:hypothetical protein